MKFTEKYEILELLTSGRVSTFLVRDRVTREQAVIHTFECPILFSPESRNQSILKHFASLAPVPPESVSEVGFDEASSSAYVATKVPTENALQSWVKSYRDFAAGPSVAPEPRGREEDATAELSTEDLRKLLRQRSSRKSEPSTPPSAQVSGQPASPSSTSAPSQQKGEFTRLFGKPEAFGPAEEHPEILEPANQKLPVSPVQSGSATGFATNFGAPTFEAKNPVTADVESPGTPPKQDSGESASFTQLFSAAQKPPVNPRQAAPSEHPTGPKEASSFTKEFLAIAGKARPGAGSATDAGMRTPLPTADGPSTTPGLPNIRKSDSETPHFEESSEGQKAGTGEFTSFFRGPFDQPRASDKPIQFPEPVQTEPAPRSGEFTQMFGSQTKIGPRDLPKTTPPQPDSNKTESFTQIFSQEAKGARLGDLRLDSDPVTPDPPIPPFRPSPSAPSAPAAPSGKAGSSAGSFPPPDMGRVPPAENTFVGTSTRSGATEMFKHPRATAPMAEPELPSGPSDFTMFVSRSQLRGKLPAEPPVPGANPAAAPPPLGMPPMPAYKPPAPPPMPAPVVPPAPKAPALAVPKAAPTGIASYWPLITVLLALFFIAAMLVMYFALKH
jgi:hypothetical protein